MLIEKSYNLPEQISLNKVTKNTPLDEYRPSYVMTTDNGRYTSDGVLVSYRFLSKYDQYVKELAFAIQIKQRFRNCTIYKYNANKLTVMFGMNYNTVKKYVSVLKSIGVAKMHNGNLTIGALRKNKCRRNMTKVYGDMNQVISQLREYIVFVSLRRQKRAIKWREGIEAASLCRNLKDVKRFYKNQRSGYEISLNRKPNYNIRMTIAHICELLSMNTRDAVAFRKHLIKNGYGFCYKTSVVCSSAKHYDESMLNSRGYVYKGVVYERDSWVDF